MSRPALRRWFPGKGLLLVLLYTAVAVVTLGANPFKHQTITPFDVLVSQRAWSFVDPSAEVRNYQRSDILNSRMPQWEVAKARLHAGELPAWNDKIAGGGAFLTVNTNLFTPAFLVFAAVPDPALGFLLAILATLVIAGTGMHALLRRHVGVAAAVVGAITFELCGFNAAWLYWPHVFTLAWAPWLLWAVDRCARRPGVGNALLVGGASALVCLGGFPFLSVIVLEAAGLYALVLLAFHWRSGERRHWRFAGWYAAGSAFGLLLAALPLVGLYLWLQQFDIGYRQGRGSYLDLGHVKQLFPPWAYDVQRVEQTMYVGSVMMALAIGGIAATVVRWRRAGPLQVFALLLLVVAAGLVFELWPMWLIGWLPGMAYNSWSRAIGLLDIALIVSGAMFLDRLWRLEHARKTAMRLALGALVIVQVVEIAMFFRDFNGPVDADYYFPETPTIEFVRERAGPFDYVITDKSFLMSGTLGVYGQREWLAHYFRSPALQRVLHRMAGHPFNSHRASASRFVASDIKYDSSAMADYNVRYALIDSRRGPDALPSVDGPSGGKHSPLPPMPTHSYTQEFPLPKDRGGLAAVSVKLATYEQSNLTGEATLVLLDTDGHALARSTIPASGIADNRFVDFPFDRPLELDPGNYSFRISYQPAPGPVLPLTAWKTANPGSDITLRVDSDPYPGTIRYRLRMMENRDSRFVPRFTAEGTTVLENRASPGGPYFLPALSRHANAQSGRDVKVVAYKPEDFTLRYDGTDNGYVVVPMSFNDDWNVTVDGTKVSPELKDGVMPSVRVSGPATIHFDYVPAVLRWFLPWLAGLGLAIVAMLVAGRWFGRSNREDAR